MCVWRFNSTKIFSADPQNKVGKMLENTSIFYAGSISSKKPANTGKYWLTELTTLKFIQ